MTRQFFTASAANPRGAFARQFGGRSWIYNIVLAANTQANIAIPAGAKAVDFSFNGDFWAVDGVSGTTTVAVPSSGQSANGAELNPALRHISDYLEDGTTAVTHICLVSGAACSGSVTFFKA
ncbi:hypothetical protein [Bosea sp. AS-1]|uniref:hypothetical protein n=1 Tax=Bosea sp. AS-1 TaxID=2015316 RepID=UPI000B780678|nr:hypothetical protein [Bosea sp. AS-1]